MSVEFNSEFNPVLSATAPIKLTIDELLSESDPDVSRRALESDIAELIHTLEETHKVFADSNKYSKHPIIYHAQKLIKRVKG